MRIKWIIAVAVLQVLVLAIPWLVNASGVLRTGRTIYNRSAPVDRPRRDAGRLPPSHVRHVDCVPRELCRGPTGLAMNRSRRCDRTPRGLCDSAHHGGRIAELVNPLLGASIRGVVHAWAHGTGPGVSILRCGMVSRPFFSSKDGAP